jgi:glycosyltransferase involved in cell wall biosynthesis
MLRIAMISTVYKRTPPVGYGGIERVVYALTEELLRQGHTVTLFATPGSQCSGETIEIQGYEPEHAPSGVQNPSQSLSEDAMYREMAAHVTRDRFDIIHDFSFDNLFVQRHPERMPFLISTCIPLPLNTNRPNLVACSQAHADLIGKGTPFVRYGLPLSDWPYRFDKERHFVHIAKIAPYKGQHEAIAAAALARRELRVVGNVEHKFYHRAIVRPMVAVLPWVSYLGETQSTSELLMPAAALIQTPRWFDAFPLIVLEALASGTPVISYGEGGVFEQIDHGINGFICDGVGDLAEMMGRIDEIEPRICRAYAQEKFTVSRMANDYCQLYGRVLDGETW